MTYFCFCSQRERRPSEFNTSKKRSKNTKPPDKILCSKGIGGTAFNTQTAVCINTLTLLDRNLHMIHFSPCLNAKDSRIHIHLRPLVLLRWYKRDAYNKFKDTLFCSGFQKATIPCDDFSHTCQTEAMELFILFRFDEISMNFTR